MNMIEKLIKYEESQVGYLEKESNKDLEPKEGPNVGDKNYTKYSQDLIEKIGKPFMNGVSWCVIFQEDSFVQVFGVEMAKKLLYVWTMSCGDLKQAFIKHKRFFKDGQAGDLVIFEWYVTKNGKKELRRHIGLVYKTDTNYIYTIEGNTSAGSNTVIENGGGVFKKSYKRNHPRINGYCRPAYVEVALPVLNRRQQIAGKNDKRQCKLLQQNLNSLGYKGKDGNKLAVDGSFGGNTEYAVKAFQRDHDLDDDGSYGKLTYRKMLEVMC